MELSARRLEELAELSANSRLLTDKDYRDLAAAASHLRRLMTPEVVKASSLSDLEDGRYHDGTYEWEKEGDEWTPLMAPMGMPSQPELSRLSRISVIRTPIEVPAG